uniref:Uncharacterized protein n=2 Tax=Caenorhabditis japonica TaxID=281687 RepID=A0A8R1DS11_CAEJA
MKQFIMENKMVPFRVEIHFRPVEQISFIFTEYVTAILNFTCSNSNTVDWLKQPLIRHRYRPRYGKMKMYSKDVCRKKANEKMIKWILFLTRVFNSEITFVTMDMFLMKHGPVEVIKSFTDCSFLENSEEVSKIVQMAVELSSSLNVLSDDVKRLHDMCCSKLKPVLGSIHFYRPQCFEHEKSEDKDKISAYKEITSFTTKYFNIDKDRRSIQRRIAGGTDISRDDYPCFIVGVHQVDDYVFTAIPTPTIGD